MSNILPLFAYGTLRYGKYQVEALGKTLVSEPDILQGFERKRIVYRGKKYFVLRKNPKKFISGKCLCVTAEDLMRLDKYESKYTREKVKLQSGLYAYVYIPMEILS